MTVRFSFFFHLDCAALFLKPELLVEKLRFCISMIPMTAFYYLRKFVNAMCPWIFTIGLEWPSHDLVIKLSCVNCIYITFCPLQSDVLRVRESLSIPQLFWLKQFTFFFQDISSLVRTLLGTHRRKVLPFYDAYQDVCGKPFQSWNVNRRVCFFSFFSLRP